MSEQESNNKNEKLALEIGRLLDEGRSPDDSGDALMDDLQQYKQDKKRNIAEQVASTDSENLWTRIQEEVSPQQSSRESARIHTLFSTPAYRWAAAAIVVIVALAGYFIYSSTLQPGPIAVARSGIETVQLSDGSRVTLRPHSQLFKLAVNDKRRSYRLSGEGLFEVSSQTGRPFSVQADRGVVTVTGTRFNLSSWGQQVRVFVEEGSVRFEHAGGDSPVELQKGQAAAISGDQPSPQRLEISGAAVMDWLDQQALFEDEKVQLVFAELEHHFSIFLKAPKDVLEEKLTGRISLEKRDVALRDLEVVLGGTFKKTGDRSYKFVQK